MKSDKVDPAVVFEKEFGAVLTGTTHELALPAWMERKVVRNVVHLAEQDHPAVFASIVLSDLLKSIAAQFGNALYPTVKKKEEKDTIDTIDNK
ncbi:hypothetical protein AYI70_g2683 [Smittium culicis]|uniref:Uncharacterized protein n=1 Tax=Smittium culicis TaxID=133412 RepID=A0A1R1Y7E0_9FUNG|nr:hypothetical protein AYI70_g2683 [Smittium culicis]